MNRTIIVTKDNSKTLLISEINETYHSKNGALNESLHIFIRAGLAETANKSTINVFELGFGTGLNALVSLNFALENKVNLNYTSIEKYPLSIDLIKKMDYPSLIKTEDFSSFFYAMHNSNWNEPIIIHPNFTLKKIDNDIAEINLEEKKYDIIFFDAFGPKVQPELWSEKIIQKMFNSLVIDGILVTYCAQGQFKRTLKKVGFEVNNIPGPNGKREMTRAIKRT